MRYRHWKNFAQAGEVAFVTTTALDWNRVFQREQPKKLMVESLLRDCAKYQAKLDAYVIMAHHVHMIVRCPQNRGITRLMQAVKRNAAARIRPILTQEEESGFDHQRELNRRLFWMNSFRSVVIDSGDMFWQKVGYIHTNPVRAGICKSEEEYEWSSIHRWLAGEWSEETGLRL